MGKAETLLKQEWVSKLRLQVGGGDIRRWLSVPPTGVLSSQSFETVSTVEGHENGTGASPESKARAEDGEQWVEVSQKRHARLANVDRRSIVIWGVPLSVSLQALARYVFYPSGNVKPDTATLRQLKVITGKEKSTVGVLTFTSLLDRDRHYDTVKQICAKKGWKALKSRTYQTRSQQRTSGKLCKVSQSVVHSVEVKQREDGYYGPLGVMDDSVACGLVPDEQDTQSLAAPHPSKDEQLAAWSWLLLGSLNIQGGIKNKIAELEKYLAKRRYDLVALQEVRNVDKLKVKGYKYYARICENGEGGVGFLVALHLVPLVKRLRSQHNNQLWLKLRGTGGRKDLYICSAYMPQESSPVDERKKVWTALKESALSFRSQGEVVLAGDMNARLGLPTTAKERRLLGPFAIGRTSANGRLLLDLLLTLDLINLAGFFKPPSPAGWVTRTDPTRVDVQSRIDYLLVPAESQRGQAASFKVDYTSLDTDHHLLHAYIPCPRKLRKPKKRRSVTRFMVEKLRERPLSKPEGEREATPAEEYQKEISNMFGDAWDPVKIAEGTSTDLNQEGVGAEAKIDSDKRACAAVLKDFLGKLDQALEKSVGSKTVHKKFSRPWFDADVRQAIQARREAFWKFKNHRTRQNWEEYKRLRLKARRLVSQKKREQWERLLQSIGEDSSKNPKRMWSNMKRIMGNNKSSTDLSCVRREDGSLAISAVDKREALSSYIAKLGQPLQDPEFNSAFQIETEALIDQYALESKLRPTDEMDKDFTDDELIAALDKLQYYKASSFDQVRNEALKEGGKSLRSNLLKLFNWINSTECVPSDWARSMVVMLYKDGDESDPGNYRGISLISCLGKLYLSLWTQRITEHIEPQLAEEQGGFRSHRSTVDQVFVFNETLLRRRRAGRTTYCFFIDFRKAFDTV